MKTRSRHVILVGLPGAGKTVVGRRVARLLGAPFFDVDAEIERASGKKVTELFEAGENEFRKTEREMMDKLIDGPPSILSSGGGWAAQPGNLDAVQSKAVLVHLVVSAEQAAARIGNSKRRPLLSDGNVRDRLEQLRTARIHYYDASDVEINTNARRKEEIALEVVEVARRLAGF